MLNKELLDALDRAAIEHERASTANSQSVASKGDVRKLFMEHYFAAERFEELCSENPDVIRELIAIARTVLGL